jgi:hypothetical protein
LLSYLPGSADTYTLAHTLLLEIEVSSRGVIVVLCFTTGQNGKKKS